MGYDCEMDIQTFLKGILTFFNKTVIPFLLAIAFLVFIVNVVRFFIIGGSSEEGQERARSLALWGIAAFVIIVSLWGIVNLFVTGLGLGNTVIQPDYFGHQ